MHEFNFHYVAMSMMASKTFKSGFHKNQNPDILRMKHYFLFK